MRSTGTALAALALLLTGCASGDTEQAEADDTEDSAATEPAESKPGNCEAVDQGWGKVIARGAEDDVGKLNVSHVAAVKSPDHGEAYYIAGEFTTPGFEDDPQVGIWASNSLKPGEGTIIAVDGFAKEFTVWPDGDQGQLEFSVTDQGAKDAVACLD